MIYPEHIAKAKSAFWARSPFNRQKVSLTYIETDYLIIIYVFKRAIILKNILYANVFICRIRKLIALLKFFRYSKLI